MLDEEIFKYIYKGNIPADDHLCSNSMQILSTMTDL